MGAYELTPAQLHDDTGALAGGCLLALLSLSNSKV